MLIRRPEVFRSSEITPERVYLKRRQFLRAAAVAGAALGTPAWAQLLAEDGRTPALPDIRKSDFTAPDDVNTWEDITTYNNFYEFGTGKTDPSERSGRFQPQPWSVRVSGACGKPGDYAFEDLVRHGALEERIYRLRCVEAWSMVIPWVGLPLAGLLQRFEPDSRAKYVAFRTVLRPQEMPGQRRGILDWPYQEGLTIAEAMHPLSLIAVGVYGRELPNQNGAPMRLVVPWKYGFKSIKSIDTIEFVETQPRTSWELAAPHEYGFYANVNPQVDHPRWSQASERPIGGGLFAPRKPTLMFNGYGEQVAHLYAGMDLRKYF